MSFTQRRFYLAVIGLLLLLLPITFLTATHLTFERYLKKLRTTYPTFTESEIVVVDVVSQVSPSVVSIVARKEVFGRTRQVLDLGGGLKVLVPGELQSRGKQIVTQGTGFVVNRQGLIATNRHVIADSEAEFEVIFTDGRKFAAVVEKKDEEHDLALLSLKEKTGKFIPLQLADFENVKIGQTVIAIGNALGQLQNTVTTGVVSALNRSIEAADSRGGVIKLSNIIQTDAAINQGNSGGPLLNTRGEVVGINVAVDQGAENIGFAVPVTELKSLLN